MGAALSPQEEHDRVLLCGTSLRRIQSPLHTPPASTLPSLVHDLNRSEARKVESS